MSTVACVLSTAANVGVLINNAVYYWLAKGIKGYFLYVMLSTSTVHLLGLLQFWVETPKFDYTYENHLSTTNGDDCVPRAKTIFQGNNVNYGSLHVLDAPNENEEVKAVDSGDDQPTQPRKSKTYECMNMFLSVRYQLVMWAASLLKGLKFLTINNINIFLVSMANGRYISLLPFVSPVVSILTKFPLGKIVDHTALHMSRAWYLLLSGCLVVLGNTLGLFPLGSVPVLIVCIAYWTISSDIMMAIEPATSSDHFGSEHIAFIGAMVYGIEALVMYSGQALFAYLYSVHIHYPSTTCYGTECFRTNFLLTMSVAIFCGILSCVYLWKYDKAFHNGKHKTNASIHWYWHSRYQHNSYAVVYQCRYEGLPTTSHTCDSQTGATNILGCYTAL